MINLTRYTWTKQILSKELIWFTGYFWQNDQLYEKEKAISWIVSNVISKGTLLEEKLREMNGSWSFVVSREKEWVLVVDPMRCFPLFYTSKSGLNRISDSLSILGENDKTILSKDNLHFYVNNSAAFSGETIYENVFDVGAGEYILLGENIQRQSYWKHPKENNLISEKEALSALTETFDAVFKRMVFYLNQCNKTVLLPLSGGMDSRLIAWALHYYGINQKVIAFTYGDSETTEEATISKQIAKALGYEWKFVLYDQTIYDELISNFDNVSKLMDFGKSTPNFQDYLALEKLKTFYPYGVVVPGFCLDVLAGLTIPPELVSRSLYSAKEILASKYGLSFEQLCKKDRIKEGYSKLSIYQTFLKTNRLSTCIVNSIRSYYALGYTVYMPFWDTELTTLFYSFPVSMRYKRNLFIRYLNRSAYTGQYENLLQIPIALNRSLSDKWVSLPGLAETVRKFKNWVRYKLGRWLPERLISTIKSKKSLVEGKGYDYLGQESYMRPICTKELKKAEIFDLHQIQGIKKPWQNWNWSQIRSIYILYRLGVLK